MSSHDETPPLAATSPLPAGRRRLVYAFGLVLIASLLAVGIQARFAPRWVCWRALGVADQHYLPEVHRAVDTLVQIRKPFGSEIRPNNQVIRWRLAFPLVAWALRLPDRVFLALPHLGCILVFAFVLHAIRRWSSDTIAATLAAGIVGTCSWFFVSTAWLTYFDSWLLLGLLVVAVSPSRTALIAACALTPWVDERFLIGLPVALVARTILVHTSERDQPWTRRCRDAGWAAAIIAPYVILRVARLATGDAGSSSYLTQHVSLDRLAEVPPERYLAGVWFGLRAAWALAAYAVWTLVRRGRRVEGALLGIALGAAVGIGLVIAGDLTRSMVVAVPAAIVGAALMLGGDATRARWALAALFALNLLLPARHVVTSFEIPIEHVVAEVQRLRQPPSVLDPKRRAQHAVVLLRGGRLVEAADVLDNAIALGGARYAHPSFAPAYVARARRAYLDEAFDEARTDARRAIQMDPSNADAWFVDGLALRALGDARRARDSLARALEVAPPSWASRVRCEQVLTELADSP